MHGNLQEESRLRWGMCSECAHPYGFDRKLGFCTITSCSAYFGRKSTVTPEFSPRPPSTREVVAAEREVLQFVRLLLDEHNSEDGYTSETLERLFNSAERLVNLDP